MRFTASSGSSDTVGILFSPLFEHMFGDRLHIPCSTDHEMLDNRWRLEPVKVKLLTSCQVLLFDQPRPFCHCRGPSPSLLGDQPSRSAPWRLRLISSKAIGGSGSQLTPALNETVNLTHRLRFTRLSSCGVFTASLCIQWLVRT